MLFVSQSGIEAIVQILIDNFNDNSVTVRLFKSPETPSFSSVLADFTESNFAGYVPLVVSNFEAGGIVGQVGYLQTHTACSFAVVPGTTPPQLSFGYYVTDSFGALLWAELDPDGPTDMSSVGNSLDIFVRLGVANCPP